MIAAARLPVTHEVGGQKKAKRVDVDAAFRNLVVSLFPLRENGNGYRHTRVGTIFDRAPDALQGFDFCLDVSEEYRDLWPQGYEPWSARSRFFITPWLPTHFPRSFYARRHTGLKTEMKLFVRRFMRLRYCSREQLFNR